ncbi:MAG: hypothetical protein ACE5GC_05595 [Acidimicrobiia bacterium]
MGQQPNIELEMSDLPRPTATVPAARRWQPDRPGDLNDPAEVPWGGRFGTTGPDAGYALALLAGRNLTLAPGEQLHNVEAGVAAIAAARASNFGRAPTPQDVDVALLLFGLDPNGLPDAVASDLQAERLRSFANLGHDAARRRTLVTRIPNDVLASAPDAIRTRLAAGEVLLTG